MGRGALGNLLAWHLDELGPGPGRRIAQFTAIGFDIAVQEIFSTLVSGRPWSCRARRRGATRGGWSAGSGTGASPTCSAPTSSWRPSARRPWRTGSRCPTWSTSPSGEQLTLSEAVRTFYRLRPGRRFYNHYGPTETHAATSYVLPVPPDEWPDRAPVGRPIWNTGIRLLDGDLAEVPGGADGEVFATGTALARGYHGRPDLTADRFVPDPYGPPGSRMYRTGDIARRRPDGMLEYLGRADQQVKIRGVRVEPGEVDAAIRALPDVRDVTVLVRGDGAYQAAGRLPGPGARRGGGGRADPRAAAGDAAGGHGPVDVHAAERAAEELQRESGPQRPARPRQPHRGASARRRLRLGPGDEAAAMARLFGECLEMDQVSPDDDLIQLGLNSLSAAKAAARIRSVLGPADHHRRHLPPRHRPSLCAALRTSGTAVPPVTPVPRGDRLPASFAQERLWVVEGLGGPGIRYHVPMAIRMRGTLDEGALRAAVRDLVDRHEALRTKVVIDCAGLRQDVLDDGAGVDLEVTRVVDVSWLDQAVRRAASRPFDLGAEIPFRAHLFSCGDDRHVLLLLIHHIAVDGWSIKPLAKDLGFAYSARLAGMAPPWRSAARPVRRPRELAARPVRRGPAVRARGAADRVLAGRAARRARTAGRGHRPAAPGRPVRVRRPGPGGDRPRTAPRRPRRGAGAGCTVFMVVHAALAVLLNRRGRAPTSSSAPLS